MTDKHSHQEFDQFASAYTDILAPSLALSGYGTNYFDEYKIKVVYSHIIKSGNSKVPRSFLNFGCGVGRSEKIISQYFPNCAIYSTDISSESIRIAKEYNSLLDNVTFAVSEGIAIPFDRTFDIIFCAGVFHHIPCEERLPILAELKSKLSPDGVLFIFEHNPWNPITRRIVATCPLDDNAHLIGPVAMGRMLRQSGFTSIVRNFIVFFPRWLEFLSPLEKMMGHCPLGAQYVMMASTHSL